MAHLQRPSIAIITFLCPYPVSDGGRFGVFSFVNDMRQMYDVTLTFKVAYSEQENVIELRKIWPEVNIQPFYTEDSIKSNAIEEKETVYKKLVRPIREIKYRKRAKKSKDTSSIAHSIYPFIPLERDFTNFIGALLNQRKYDIVQVEYSDLLNLVHIIPDGPKKVFFQHENRFLILEDYFSVNKDQSYYADYVIRAAMFTEVNLMNLYDRILVLNRNDQARLNKLIPLHKLKVLPTSVPARLIPRLKNRPSRAERLVFMGSQEHHPNMDGVKWFADDMMTDAKAKTGLDLYVTGKWRDGFKFLYPQIRFTGFVDDIGQVLENSILVAPIRLGGGGIRIKILQAMACGIPVVATSLITNGMEGIIHGTNIFIADTPQEFVEAIQQLVDAPGLYETVSKNSISLIDEHYSDAAAIRVKERIFGELMSE